MDSFEWFGGIGNQQYDSLKPPGDIHRQTFDTAHMGLESFGGGGGGNDAADDQRDYQEKVAERQYEFDKLREQYNWDQLNRGAKDSLIRNIITRYKQEENLQYKEQTMVDKWMHENAMREHRFNTEMEAYNRSERLYEKQVNYNMMQAKLSYEAEAQVTHDRYMKLAFDTAKYASKHSQAQYKATQQHGMLQMQRDSKRADIGFSLTDMYVKKLQAKGQIAAKGQAGASTEKQIQSVIAAEGRAHAGMLDKLTRSDEMFNAQIYGVDNAIRYENYNYSVTQDELAATKDSITKRYNTRLKQIQHREYGANLQAESRRRIKPKLGPSIPVPRALPRGIVLDKPPLVRGPKPIKGSVYQGSTGGGGGSPTGAIIGAVGGLASASAALPFVGAAMGPIGMGITAIGMLGSWQGWW